MAKQLEELQRALRDIERGARLETLDNVLVRRVLQRPVVAFSEQQQQQQQQELEAAVVGHEAYRTLVELRRSKKQQQLLLQRQQRHNEHDGAAALTAVSAWPVEVNAVCLIERSAPTDGIVHTNNGASPTTTATAHKLDVIASAELVQADRAMQRAVQAREHELARSQRHVQRAGAELQTLLEQSQALLPSQFLFERQLTAFCQDRSLQVVTRVLQRFQHRCYRLYFAHWCTVTLAMRRAAHERAAATIKRVFRGHCARQLARRMQQQLSEHARQVAALLAFRASYRNRQALRIQMNWRRYKRARAVAMRQQRRDCAAYLQRVFCDRRLRQNQFVHTLLHARSIRAAILLQRYYRGHRARRAVRAKRHQLQRDALVAATLARSVSPAALMQWKFARRGAAFLLCTRALYPYALRQRLQRLVRCVQQQRAAQIIARSVCRWFGVSARREAAAAARLDTWLHTLAVEQQRTCAAAVRIQSHLRRWVQQRAYAMAQTRRRKLARAQRLAVKAAAVTKGGNRQLRAGAASSSSAAVLTTSKLAVAALKGLRLPRSGGKSQQLESAEHRAAQCIQRCYRRHVDAVARSRRRWRTEACRVEQRVIARRHAAVAIQRRVRGQQARLRCRQLRAEKRIHSFVRMWRWRRVLRFVQAARRIGRWLRHKHAQRVGQLWRCERKRQHVMAARVQRCVRRRLVFRCRFLTVLEAARRREETQLFCAQSLVVCTQHFTDELVVASLQRSLEDALRAYLPVTRPPTATAKTPSSPSPTNRRGVSAATATRTVFAPPPFFPVLQLVFLVVSGAKDPTKWRLPDDKALLNTTLERSRVVALFKTVNRHQQDAVATKAAAAAVSSTPSALTSSPSKAKKSKAPLFAMTDVDLALAKASTSKRALAFDEFVRVLRLLGDMKLAARVPVWWSRFAGSDAALLALLWRYVFVLPELASVLTLLTDFVHREMHARCVRIQQLLMRGRNRQRGLLLQLQRRQEIDAAVRSRAATRLQAHARVLLARRALRERIQCVYEKYIDPEWALPYWTNPVTGYSTWCKPRALRADDVAVEVVPYPSAQLTLKLACDGAPECVKCAEWFCFDCDEHFCAVCLPVYHRDKAGASETLVDTGVATLDTVVQSSTDAVAVEVLMRDIVTEPPNVDASAKQQLRSRHEMEQIALCGLCQFQVASRKCVSCFAAAQATAKALRSSKLPTQQVLASLSPARSPKAEALFCDVCFAYMHRRGALTEHKSLELLEMCTACTSNDDDDADDDDTVAGAVRDVKTEPAALSELALPSGLTPPPLARAVQWQCGGACDRHVRVCGQCVSTRHPIELCGAEPSHVALRTQSMLERAQRLADEAEARDRADVDRMKQRALAAKRERCATKVQRFWRRRIVVLRAKRLTAQLLIAKRAHWTQRQADAKRETQFVYAMRNAIGRAPPLATDSPVQRRLRELNALQRRQLEIRARMFGLLTPEYMRVGIPLPGVGRVSMAADDARVIETSEDLRGWVKNRQTLRLRRIAVSDDADAKAPNKHARRLETHSAWFHLAHWDRASDSSSESNELLVDVDTKEKPTERRIVLQQPLVLAVADGQDPTGAATGTGTRTRTGDDDKLDAALSAGATDDHVFVMYLVEYSMDPTRVVWINHSLAERFWTWKRQRALERKRQRELAKDIADAKARTAAAVAVSATLTGDDDPMSGDAGPAPQQDADGQVSTYPVEIAPGAFAPDASAYYSAGDAVAGRYPTSAYGYETTDGYGYETTGAYGYDPSAYSYDPNAYGNDPSAYSYDPSVYGNDPNAYGYDANAAPAAYDGHAYGYGYSDANYSNAGVDTSSGYSTYPAYSEPPTGLLVDSSGYFSAPDGNAAAWQGYDYDPNVYEQPDANTDGNSYDSTVGADNAAAYNGGTGNYGDAAAWYSGAAAAQQFAVASDAGASYSTTDSATAWTGDGYTTGSADPYTATSVSGYNDAFTSGSYSDSGSGYDTAPAESTAVADAASWEEVFDPHTQQVYYVNRNTGESAWELPSALY